MQKLLKWLRGGEKPARKRRLFKGIEMRKELMQMQKRKQGVISMSVGR